jgi:hypothetical protein
MTTLLFSAVSEVVVGTFGLDFLGSLGSLGSLGAVDDDDWDDWQEVGQLEPWI